jgi:hypothetical protein
MYALVDFNLQNSWFAAISVQLLCIPILRHCLVTPSYLNFIIHISLIASLIKEFHVEHTEDRTVEVHKTEGPKAKRSHIHRRPGQGSFTEQHRL